MVVCLKHAFLEGTPFFPDPPNNNIVITLDNEKLKNSRLKAEWQATLVMATPQSSSPSSSFPDRFQKIIPFIKSLKINYFINSRPLPYINLFNTIIMDGSGVSSAIASRETVVPVIMKLGYPNEFAITVEQDKKIDLPAHSRCLLYVVLRGSITPEGY